MTRFLNSVSLFFLRTILISTRSHFAQEGEIIFKGKISRSLDNSRAWILNLKSFLRVFAIVFKRRRKLVPFHSSKIRTNLKIFKYTFISDKTLQGDLVRFPTGKKGICSVVARRKNAPLGGTSSARGSQTRVCVVPVTLDEGRKRERKKKLFPQVVYWQIQFPDQRRTAGVVCASIESRFSPLRIKTGSLYEFLNRFPSPCK